MAEKERQLKPTREEVAREIARVATCSLFGLEAIERDPTPSVSQIIEEACLQVLPLEQDSWRGPEERPEIEQTITAFFTFKNREREVIGYYDADDDGGGIHCYDEGIDWDQVLCWHPIDFGPMPERFKTVREGEE